MERSKGHRRHRRVREEPAPRYSAQPKVEGVAGVLLDTDVVIDIFRGRKGVIEAAERLDRERCPLYCSPITWAEIFAGLRPGEEAMTEGFLMARGEVILDVPTGRRAGAYMARYRKSHGLEISDALIAAAATTSGLKLWTLNRRHYPMTDLVFYEP